MSTSMLVDENDESINSSRKESSSSSRGSIPNSSSDCSTTIDNVGNDDGESISERFIQIVDCGKPSLPNGTSGTVDTAEVGDQLSDDNEVTVYLLDATIEDPFTLESFDTLIQQHAEKGKDFILARVTTADSSDDSKTYQSYYSAHQINKVLFRTQPDQGLLHRMKAKNPLNNMNIIGDVHYYVVKAESVGLTQQSFAKSSAMSIASHKTLHLNGDSITMAEISATSALDKSDGDFVINIGEGDKETLSRGDEPGQLDRQTPEGAALRRMTNTSKERRWSSGDLVQQPPRVYTPEYSLHVRRHQSMTGIRPSSSVLNSRKMDTIASPSKTTDDKSMTSSPSPSPQSPSPQGDKDSVVIKNGGDSQIRTTQTSPTPTYEAIFYATDDDFLTKSQVRQYFKINTIDPLDSQLFSINTSTQNASATGTLGILSQNFDDTGITPNQAYRDSILRANEGSRWTRPLRAMRMNKGVKWLVLMYMIFGILLIKFVVSATYVYLMAFLLMLCLFLVFCVGSGVCFWEGPGS